MEQKKYWQSFGEFSHSDEYKKSGEDEFKSALPFEDLDEKGLLDEATPRRDFLKYLGFSTAAAMAVASCEMPVRKSIPYLNKPQDLLPGESNYYATTFVSGGDVVSVVAKVKDGRPIYWKVIRCLPLQKVAHRHVYRLLYWIFMILPGLDFHWPMVRK